MRKGERAAPAILYETRCLDGEAGDGSDDKVLRSLKSYGVVNASQIEGLPAAFHAVASADPGVTVPLSPDVQAIMANFPVTVSHGGDVACYQILSDRTSMPDRSAFKSDEDYVAVLLHEFAHNAAIWIVPHGLRKGCNFKGKPEGASA